MILKRSSLIRGTLINPAGAGFGEKYSFIYLRGQLKAELMVGRTPTAIVPAKVRKPKYKSSVENSVGILEKGFFHDLEERQYFSLEQFNSDLWEKLDELNHENFKNKEHSRCYYWEEERSELMPLPSVPYEYMERKEAKVSSDFHVRFGI